MLLAEFVDFMGKCVVVVCCDNGKKKILILACGDAILEIQQGQL